MHSGKYDISTKNNKEKHNVLVPKNPQNIGSEKVFRKVYIMCFNFYFKNLEYYKYIDNLLGQGDTLHIIKKGCLQGKEGEMLLFFILYNFLFFIFSMVIYYIILFKRFIKLSVKRCETQNYINVYLVDFTW